MAAKEASSAIRSPTSRASAGLTRVAGFDRNGWPTSVGIGGRIASESVAALRRITHGLFRSTRQAFLEQERSKAELKALMPEDAKQAIGHGIRAKRSKSGAVSFDLLEAEDGRAAL